MTDASQFAGKTISSIIEGMRYPDSLFSFLNPGGNDFPVLAVACFDAVPMAAESGGWKMANEQCMGYLCSQIYVVAKTLRYLSEPPWRMNQLDDIEKLMASVWNEEFSADSLDYGPQTGDAEAYRKLLSDFGVSWTYPYPDGRSGGKLVQAVYPIDATDENLSILTGGEFKSISEFLKDDPKRCGAWIVVFGQNCD